MLPAATVPVQPRAAVVRWRTEGSRRGAASAVLPLVLVVPVLLGHALMLGLLPAGAAGGSVARSGAGSAHLRVMRGLAPVPLTLPAGTAAAVPAEAGARAPKQPQRGSAATIGANASRAADAAIARPARRVVDTAAPATAPVAIAAVIAPVAAVAGDAAMREAAVGASKAVAEQAVAATAPAAASDAASDGGSDGGNTTATAASVPVYPTRLPAAVELHFDISRGAARGRAALRWLPGPAGYVLTLEGDGSPAVRWLDWRSQGGFDADGVAPERYADRRRGRDLRAANFQRDKGLLTYSGPPIEQALPPGAQDRLSWMLQLPAIVQADAERAVPGARTTLFVTGARGDADVWTFVVEGVEAVDTADGRVPAVVHLRRLPRRPYDTLVDVWLDPARAHLPARLRLATQQSAAEAIEFVLRDIAVP